LFLAREPVAFEGGVIDVDRHLESVLECCVSSEKSARSRYVVRGACVYGDEFVDRREASDAMATSRAIDDVDVGTARGHPEV